MGIEQESEFFRERVAALRAEVAKVIVGYEDVVEQVIVSLLAGGHVLLEGVPGLGKTLLVRTLAECLALRFGRIQFTPDLMPADITGTHIVVEDPGGGRAFQFRPGPIFGNIVLADEINRATPKTQSALLEAMQEHSVTAAGERHALPDPFFVLATQNPIEMEGTYPLPEAQLDRFFFKIEIPSASVDQLVEVLERTTRRETARPQPVIAADQILRLRNLARDVPVARHVMNYAARLVLATHPGTPDTHPAAAKYVRFGASPRGGQALILAAKILSLMRGRFNASFEDIRKVAVPALRHRLILNFEGEAEGVRTDAIIRQVVDNLPELPATQKSAK